MASKITNALWFKDAVIYELSVRAFQDSNADGIGDFPGLIQRLDTRPYSTAGLLRRPGC